ncbi:tetratricopeptide repeat protein [Luteimonas sp. 8-5]|uniref:YfgM family protein n=1 Tax=Luteimonas sp. 8-5 TaxID=3039387 RepID=UPI0024367A63|nr:tetratricopeptide repeat protein [Luteimonas sp. 8-5]MDG6347947.1 tetratricopeptide repeat protein [Luteimonas sp. 8-5]
MAIDDLLDEHEQGERVRSWLRANGAGILGGIVLGLALIWGWQWWQQQRSGKQMQAGADFLAATSALEQGATDKAKAHLEALPEGAYATLGALSLARSQVEAGQRDEAIATLRAIKADDPALAEVAVQRLARLLIDTGKPKEALAALAGLNEDAGTLQVRGDAYAALEQDEQAREAYTRALALIEVGSPQRNMVELKLSDVGGDVAATEAGS